jgi:hypothetical protein|nr:MAG TPA: hypothetical protein [Caudoviricetes sp.]
MERRDVVLAHWLEFQNGDDTNAHIRSFERAWDFSARIRDLSNAVLRMSSRAFLTETTLMTRVALGKRWRLPQRIEICYQRLRDRNTQPHTWCEDSREFAYVVSRLYKLTLDFEILRVLPSVIDLMLKDLEAIIQDIMRRAALDSNVYKPTAELKRKLKIANEKLSRN